MSTSLESKKSAAKRLIELNEKSRKYGIQYPETAELDRLTNDHAAQLAEDFLILTNEIEKLGDSPNEMWPSDLTEWSKITLQKLGAG